MIKLTSAKGINAPADKPRKQIKVLIFDGAYKFGAQNFGQDEKAATEERNKFYNQNATK